MLELKSISKTFNPGTVNEKCALHDLSLSVPDGDFYHHHRRERAPENPRCSERSAETF